MVKITKTQLTQIVQEELSEVLGMDQEFEGQPEENVALKNLTAAVDSLVQNWEYTIEEVLEIVHGLGTDQVADLAEDKEALDEISANRAMEMAARCANSYLEGAGYVVDKHALQRALTSSISKQSVAAEGKEELDEDCGCDDHSPEEEYEDYFALA